MIIRRTLRRGRPPAIAWTTRSLATHAINEGRVNEVAVPLISESLRQQLFPPRTSPLAPAPPSKEAIAISRAHLASHALLASAPSKPPPATAFELPRLQGPTISHHFQHLGEYASTEYKKLVTDFVARPVPAQPDEPCWSFTPGWTHYHSDGSFEPVPHLPEHEKVLVFDVETLPHVGGDWAVMAVALGTGGWYSWASPWLTGHSESPAHLIPLGPSRQGADNRLMEDQNASKRVIVGHNVLFDRARVQDEYSLQRPSTRWLDTMSLHVAVSGLTSPQRPGWMAYRKDRDQNDSNEQSADSESTDGRSAKNPDAPKTWHEMSSMNSLNEVARLHCGIRRDKAARNILINPATTLEDLRNQFSLLMAYCASDVAVTHAVLVAVLPKFLTACPHPASLAGALLMSQPVLPVDSRWPQYLERADAAYAQRLDAVRDKLCILAEDARQLMGQQDADGKWVWESDVQLRQLDWSPKRARRLPRGSPSSLAAATSPAFDAACSENVQATKAKSQTESTEGAPRWHQQLSKGDGSVDLDSPLTTLLLETTYRGFPVVHSSKDGWAYAVIKGTKHFKPQEGESRLSDNIDEWKGYRLFAIPAAAGKGRTRKLFARGAKKRFDEGVLACEALADQSPLALDPTSLSEIFEQRVEAALSMSEKERAVDPWLKQLDWTQSSSRAAPVQTENPEQEDSRSVEGSKPSLVTRDDLVWPKWYWDLDQSDGSGLEVTIKKRAIPLLLKLLWKGFPVVHSREYGWVYRVPYAQVNPMLEDDSALKPLSFKLVADSTLADESGGAEPLAAFFRLPHPDGDENNVGNPLSRAFLGAAEDGVLSSVYPVAREALDLNAECSYWAAARERIVNQLVVWDGDASKAAPAATDTLTKGLILPCVTPMGTVTRRAIERTWLTASNAKKNRVGSELKAMVRAPPGYAIVGADVDSEELWICAVMGDAQFGVHGATAVGWMTLEGTKSAGTDLHSKTASILGISRDHAKAFNYSRIYGAGVKHAVQLLLKANPLLTKAAATELVNTLYASTKGLKHRGAAHGGDFWHGGTESFVFNKLEDIAKDSSPKTPAFGCGLTTALTKKYLPAEGRSKKGAAFMPSRINWVVQSSGVDYLHALLVSMEYLTTRFGIDARYMISVHDEIRYLVKEEDKYRAAMALQIANLWTRALFCYRLQMDDLPQSCAFFSAVDVDHCFRKEVNMTCVTPSNPDAIPFGESLDIDACLAATAGGSLAADGQSRQPTPSNFTAVELKSEQVCGSHRAEDVSFLSAQSMSKSEDITAQWFKSRRATKPSKPRQSKKMQTAVHPWMQSPSPATQEKDDFEDDAYVPPEFMDDYYSAEKTATAAAAP